MLGFLPCRQIICQHKIPMLDDVEHGSQPHRESSQQPDSPSRVPGPRPSPVLGPRPAQNVQQNESSMSGSFSKNIFDYRGNKFHRIANTMISSMARIFGARSSSLQDLQEAPLAAVAILVAT